MAGVITGFTMGEGSFFISVGHSKTNITGYQIRPKFKITLHSADKKILEDICDFFKCGDVTPFKNSESYKVVKLDDLLEIIIPFFDRYPLKNIKEADFQSFKIICYKLMHGEGKSMEGIRKILTIRSVMNGGEKRKRKNDKL